MYPLDAAVYMRLHFSGKIFFLPKICNQPNKLASNRQNERRRETYHPAHLEGRDCSLRAFLNTYGQQVFILVARIVSNQEDAEELTQDVFLKAFQHLSSFKGTSSFSTWIYSIAYNTAISSARKKKFDTFVMDDALLANISDTQVDEALNDEGEEQIAKLNRAMEQLDSEEQALISLFYYEEKTLNEVALILGLTESNAKVKLHRIRKKIYVLMKQEKV